MGRRGGRNTAARAAEHGALLGVHARDGEEAARLYGILRERTPEELSRLAAHVWARLYGSELPSIRLIEQ